MVHENVFAVRNDLPTVNGRIVRSVTKSHGHFRLIWCSPGFFAKYGLLGPRFLVFREEKMDNRTILIVDDDVEVQSFLADFLHGDGWQVLLETDGDWALKTFRSRRVDAVLLDIYLPVMNGFQVAEALRGMPEGRNVPIVMLSGVYRGKTQREEVARKYGLLGYLTKPIKVEELRNLLKGYFGSSYPDASESKTKKKKGRHTLLLERAAAKGVAGESAPSASKVGRGRIPLRGNLKENDFPFVLGEISRVQATGALFILEEKTKKIVYFNNGVPVYVKSNLLRECLGRMLVRENIIDEGQCEQSLARMKKSGGMQGAELIEMGLIRADDLVAALKRQMEIKLLGVFALDGAKYTFKENVHSPSHEFKPESSVATLIYKGVMAATPRSRIEKEMLDCRGFHPAPAEDPSRRFQLIETETEEERFFLESIDATRNVDEIVEKAGIGHERARSVLYAALSSGILELWDGPVRKGRLNLGSIKVDGKDLALMSERAVVEHLSDKLAALQNRDCFEILGVQSDVDEYRLDIAFEKLASSYHPDRFVGSGVGSQELAESLFEIYKEAYYLLKDGAAKEVSGKQVHSAEEETCTRPAALESAIRTLEAAKHLDEGLAAEEKKDWENAAENYRRAVEVRPKRWDLRTRLGWALMNCPGRDDTQMEKARKHLQKAVELNPGAYQPYLYLGYFFENAKDLDAAEKEFQKALHRDPRCREAKMALARLMDR